MFPPPDSKESLFCSLSISSLLMECTIHYVHSGLRLRCGTNRLGRHSERQYQHRALDLLSAPEAVFCLSLYIAYQNATIQNRVVQLLENVYEYFQISVPDQKNISLIGILCLP